MVDVVALLGFSFAGIFVDRVVGLHCVAADSDIIMDKREQTTATFLIQLMMY